MTINVAVIGVGSFCKALVEGVSFYTKNPNETTGLIHPKIGNYSVADINFTCAFDVDARKVGRPLSNAIYLGANVTRQITTPLDYSAIVYRGPTIDGVIKEMQGKFIQESKTEAVNVSEILKQTKTDAMINLVPSGSDEATYFYARQALDARCSFINCIPTPLATLYKWREKFESKELVLLGDDIKSQLGATMLNRFLLQLLKIRGIKVTHTFQNNTGGNADHFNLLYRKEHKEKSKTSALGQFIDKKETKTSVNFNYTGVPSGHKTVNIKIEGEMFGKTPIAINAVIEDEISINGAGTLVDAIRISKLLVDIDKAELASKACAFLMKTPPVEMDDLKALEEFNKLIS